MNNIELDKIIEPNNYTWIKIKRYDSLEGDIDQIFENTDGLGKDYIVEEYIKLREHHKKETELLINKCKELANIIKNKGIDL